MSVNYWRFKGWLSVKKKTEICLRMRNSFTFFCVCCWFQDQNLMKYSTGEEIIKQIQTVFRFKWHSYSHNAQNKKLKVFCVQVSAHFKILRANQPQNLSTSEAAGVPHKRQNHTMSTNMAQRVDLIYYENGWSALCNTVRSHLSKHAGTKGCSDNWNVRKIIQFVYKVKHFPFNAQQNLYEYHYFGGPDLDHWSSDKWLSTVVLKSHSQFFFVCCQRHCH